ncbi:MAG: di-trans,poly-cis-decaprenylcistransferase [Acidobacteriota bacterium]|nr:di-trans,poly-cis-decaprenylcistransferase [Acidobacteriota bacterium]MDH3785166.1 di-trans,poly-cis-decaprenylcistransferase [Acidobacteriota bacterium]
MQSNLFDAIHVALIMDGNGRWARRLGRERVAGHREGARSVRRVVEAAPDLGIGTLTLYAFSSDNWSRPKKEVDILMGLFRRYLRNERARCIRHGVRISVVGRRDRLAPDLVREIEVSERATRHGSRLHLRIAVDYSSRQAILRAVAGGTTGEPLTEESFGQRINEAMHSDPPAPDVDLLVRTSGEQRLSDFLLWESAYAELLFTDRMWPEFDEDDLADAVEAYHLRSRRFGALPEIQVAAQ